MSALDTAAGTRLSRAALFGGAIGGSTGKYLGYRVPGILVMTLLVTTGTTGAALSIDIASGVFDRFRTLSIRPVAMLIGAILGDLARYAMAWKLRSALTPPTVTKGTAWASG